MMIRFCFICLLGILFFLVSCNGLETTEVEYETGQHPKEFERHVVKTVGCNYLLYLP